MSELTDVNDYYGNDPAGKAQHEKGAKLDLGKAPIFDGVLQYFPRALVAIANLSQWGATRYTWEGWRDVPNAFRRYSNALGRHILKEKTEGLYDLDARNDPKFPAEILHATQVVWNGLARLEKLLEELDAKK